MKPIVWKSARIGLVAVGLIAALVSCNSHMLLKSGDPEVVIIDPPPVAPPPPVQLTDAGLPTVVFPPVTLDEPDTAVPPEDTAPPADSPWGVEPGVEPGPEPGPEPALEQDDPGRGRQAQLVPDQVRGGSGRQRLGIVGNHRWRSVE